jgi:hypothetical protein
MSEQQEPMVTPPAQSQEDQPGREESMRPRPDYEPLDAGERLLGRKALITGGDSGIGRAVAVGFAAQGADVALVGARESFWVHTDLQAELESDRSPAAGC